VVRLSPPVTSPLPVPSPVPDPDLSDVAREALVAEVESEMAGAMGDEPEPDPEPVKPARTRRARKPRAGA